MQRLSDHALVVAVVLALLLVLSPARAAENGSRDVMAAASPRAVFVAQVQSVGPAKTQTLQTQVYRRSLNGDGHFLHLITISDRIRSFAAQGDHAFALMDDGQWMTIWPNSSPLGPTPPNTQLLLLAADEQALWALGKDHAPPATTSTSQPTTAVVESPGSKLSLYRMKGSVWERIGSLPPQLANASAEDLSLAVSGDDVTVAVAGFDGIVLWTRSAGEWTALPPIRPGHLAQDDRVLESGQPPIVWSIADGAAFLSRGGHDVPLPADGAPASAPRSAACAAEAVRVFSETDDNLFEQAYGLDGKKIGQRTKLAIDESVTASDPESWITLLLTILVSALLFGSAWSREIPAPDVLIEANAQLAPPLLRFLAGLIDLLPIFIATAIVVAQMPHELTTTVTITAGQLALFYCGMAVYLIHTAVGEWLTSRSLGKRILGLRVIRTDGSRAAITPILIRTVLRLIDVLLVFLPLALILLSPLRQRLGDLAADTIVVRDGVVLIDPKEDDDEPVEPAV